MFLLSVSEIILQVFFMSCLISQKQIKKQKKKIGHMEINRSKIDLK